MSISAVILTYNNEDTIRRCLDSIIDQVDEIVIYDTGSKDKTLDIARKYTSKIIKGLEIKDFAEARNNANMYASGEWILSIDSDEEFSGVPLKEYLKANAEYDGIMVPIYSYGADGALIMNKLVRIFKRRYRFRGIIHETVIEDILEHGGKILDSDQISILHRGYEDKELVKLKNARNRRLLRYALKHEPNNPKYLFYLLRDILQHKSDHFKTAYHLCNRILNSNAHNYLKARTISIWLQYLMSRNKIVPKLIEPYLNALESLDLNEYKLLYACYSYLRKDWESAYTFSKDLVSDWRLLTDVGGIYIHSCLNLFKYEEGYNGLKLIARKSSYAYKYSAMCAYKLGLKDEARRLANEALNLDPYDPVATSLINQIDLERYKPLENGKVLIASVVRQDAPTLKVTLESWANIDCGNNERFYLFIDNNDDPESSELLENFWLPHKVIRVKPILPYFKCSVHIWDLDGIREVARMRNMYLDFARENQFDFVLAIDADIKTTPQLFKELEKWNKPVISPVFWTDTRNQIWAQVWLQDQYSHYHKNKISDYTPEEKAKSAKLFIKMLKTANCPVRVGGLGACTLIRKDVIQSGVSYTKVYNTSFFGEDRDFCIRVISHGFDLWALVTPEPLVEHLYYGVKNK